VRRAWSNAPLIEAPGASSRDPKRQSGFGVSATGVAHLTGRAGWRATCPRSALCKAVRELTDVGAMDRSVRGLGDECDPLHVSGREGQRLTSRPTRRPVVRPADKSPTPSTEAAPVAAPELVAAPVLHHGARGRAFNVPGRTQGERERARTELLRDRARAHRRYCSVGWSSSTQTRDRYH